VLCVYFVLDWCGFHRWHSTLVVFKFNNQKITQKSTLNKRQCLFKVVFGVIFCLLNLNVTKVQSNFVVACRPQAALLHINLSLCAYINALTLSLSFSVSLSLSHSRSLSLSFSLSVSLTHTNTHLNTNTHTYTHTHIQLASLRCQYRDCQAPCSNTTRYVRAHTWTHTYAHTYTHTHLHTHTYARTHSHIQTHSYTHAHTHTHTHKQLPSGILLKNDTV